MATLLDLRGAGRVIKLDPELGPRRQEFRLMYVLPELRQWIEDTLPTLGSTWKIEQSPLEQFDAWLDTYCSGEALTYQRHFYPLNHIKAGIWEMKTADLRVFGWFSAVDCFIGANAGVADQIKRLNMYRPYCEEALRRRAQLDLDEPKFIPGDNPHAVVTNFDFP